MAGAVRVNFSLSNSCSLFSSGDFASAVLFVPAGLREDREGNVTPGGSTTPGGN